MKASREPPAQALVSLLRWWSEAGVEEPPPAPAPAPREVRRPPSGTAPAEDAGAKDRRSATRREPAPAVGSPAERPSAYEDLLAQARALAAEAMTLAELEAAVARFPHPLATAARNAVFARGAADAQVMVIGEAPGRDEDRAGKPFVGRSGQLLDRMFAEIGLADAENLYITNVVNWRPRDNRSPGEADIALCRPFIARHVVLKAPKVLVFAGAIAAQTLLRVDQGITRLRGKWRDYRADGADAAIPAIAIYHPAYLLRRPISKREAWADLMAIREALERD